MHKHAYFQHSMLHLNSDLYSCTFIFETNNYSKLFSELGCKLTLLLYNNSIIATGCKLLSSVTLLQVQQSNYCTFYDDQRQNWSLMFESEKSASDFCKEVSLKQQRL